jgi:NAD(P)-dependent dehydrogenase (short-subunit alcohol dehydrogenase family)
LIDGLEPFDETFICDTAYAAVESCASHFAPPRLAAQYALVTGASQGIGRAIAIRFAQEGATVAINFLHHRADAEDTLARAQAASREHGHGERDHLVIQADIGAEANIARMFETILARWSRLDCLVNNAGFQQGAPSEAIDIETYRRILEVDLTGAVLCAQKALTHFVSRGGGGSIVNCSSVHQIIPKPGYLAYSISKGGMANLTRTLALEFADRYPGLLSADERAAIAADRTAQQIRWGSIAADTGRGAGRFEGLDRALAGRVEPVERGVAQSRRHRVSDDDRPNESRSDGLRPHPVTQRGKEEKRDERFEAVGSGRGHAVNLPIHGGLAETVTEPVVHCGGHDQQNAGRDDAQYAQAMSSH